MSMNSVFIYGMDDIPDPRSDIREVSSMGKKQKILPPQNPTFRIVGHNLADDTGKLFIGKDTFTSMAEAIKVADAMTMKAETTIYVPLAEYLIERAKMSNGVLMGCLEAAKKRLPKQVLANLRTNARIKAEIVRKIAQGLL